MKNIKYTESKLILGVNAVMVDGSIPKDRLFPKPPVGFEWYLTTVKKGELKELNANNNDGNPLYKVNDKIFKVRKVIAGI